MNDNDLYSNSVWFLAFREFVWFCNSIENRETSVVGISK